MACSHCTDADLPGEIKGYSEVKVNRSILEAYALMRGPLTGSRGPLYDLCPGKQQCSFISSDTSGDKLSIPELSSRSKAFPRLMASSSVTESQMPSSLQNRGGNRYEQELGFEAPAEYGFLKVNGKWVDPDSEEAIHDAWKTGPKGSGPPSCETCGNRGAHILSESEQSLVYAEFEEDEDDHEGDPRLSRISSGTFALWADGAIMYGNHHYGFTETVQELQRIPRRGGAERAKPTIVFPQYDSITGDRLSPTYSVDQEPIPLLSSQGLDINHCPCNFSYSYPLDDLQYKIDCQVEHTLPSASGIEYITSDIVPDELAMDGNNTFEARQSLVFQNHIERLEQAYLTSNLEARHAKAVHEALTQEVTQLQGELTSMRARVHTIITEATRQTQHKEHLKNYIGKLTHQRVTAQSTALRLQARNASLREQAGRLLNERQHLLEIMNAL